MKSYHFYNSEKSKQQTIRNSHVLITSSLSAILPLSIAILYLLGNTLCHVWCHYAYQIICESGFFPCASLCT